MTRRMTHDGLPLLEEPQLRLTHGKAAVEYWYKRLEA